MAAVAILVNGAPGPARSGIAAALAELLECPLLGREAVARSLADLAGPMIPRNALDVLAAETAWAMAGAVEAGVVVEDAWRPSRDRAAVVAGLARAGDPRVVEVHCVDASGSGADDEEGPLAVGPVLRVDTAERLDVPALVTRLGELFG